MIAEKLDTNLTVKERMRLTKSNVVKIIAAIFSYLVAMGLLSLVL